MKRGFGRGFFSGLLVAALAKILHFVVLQIMRKEAAEARRYNRAMLP